MRTDLALGRIGLRATEVAEALGISRDTWDVLWRSEQAPQPAQFTTRLMIWSRDELRAWLASGSPPLEDWKRIWHRMLEKGIWGSPELHMETHRSGDDAA